MQTLLAPGDVLAGYRVESYVARGGMAVVYRARDVALGRRVALKLIAPELSMNERFRLRFMRESELAAAIDHPNIIPIYRAGEENGHLYIAMRFVDGEDLGTVLARQGPLRIDQLLPLFTQIAGALDAAHADGLVHRDVKPGNVLLAGHAADLSSRHVYLTDFGLTKRSSSLTGFTTAGHFLGTIQYVAPEQITSGTVDGRTDVYALGCVLYEALVGEPPYMADHDAGVLWAHMASPIPSVIAHLPDLPPAVDEVLAVALAKEPDGRPDTCLAVIGQLRAALGGRPPAAHGSVRVAQPDVDDSHPTDSAESSNTSLRIRATSTSPQASTGPHQTGRDEILGPVSAPPLPVESTAQPSWEWAQRRARPRPLILGAVAAALAVLLATVAVVSLTRQHSDGWRTYAGTLPGAPFSFQEPAAWGEHPHGDIFVVFSPHRLADLFNEQWNEAKAVASSDGHSLVGVYTMVTTVRGYDLNDRPRLADELRALIPGTETFTSTTPVNLARHGAVRLEGTTRDPKGSTTLGFSYYVVDIGSKTKVHLMFFSRPQDFEGYQQTFNRIVQSLDFSKVPI